MCGANVVCMYDVCMYVCLDGEFTAIGGTAHVLNRMGAHVLPGVYNAQIPRL